jgi:hypothetical protein
MFRYGSTLIAVTFSPRDIKRRPIEEEVIPLPKPDITPPVTKIYFIVSTGLPNPFGRISVFARWPE